MITEGQNQSMGEWQWSKNAYHWEFAELYYRIEKAEKSLESDLTMESG